MSDLKEGDVCIIVESVHPEFPIGAEIIILKDYSLLGFHGYGPWYQYLIGTDGPYFYYAPRYALRKKQPPPLPREQLGEWELCPWRPLTKTVTVNEKP